MDPQPKDALSASGDEPRPGGEPVLANAVMLTVFAFTWLLVLFGLLFIVPRFQEIFASLDIRLPLPTMLTLWASRLCVQSWFVVLPAAALLTALPWLVARRRAWMLYVIATLMVLSFALGGFVSIYLPITQIQKALNKR